MGRTVLAAILALATACAEHDPPSDRGGDEAAPGDATVGGRVVATVEGEPITIGDVERLARRTGMSPRDALRRLEEQVLLAREARRRGYADDPEAGHVRKQAAVQALLAREVEEAIAPDSIASERVRERYESESADQWARPERRGTVHVLAKMAPDVSAERDRGGERFAARVLHELAFADDPQQVLDRYREPADRPFEVVVEEIPPKPRDAGLAQPYLDAVFDVEGPGVVAAPVRTRIGWHAIRVSEIEPARAGTLEEVSGEIRDELVQRRRQRRLVELLRELRRRTPVRERADAIARAMRAAGVEDG